MARGSCWSRIARVSAGTRAARSRCTSSAPNRHGSRRPGWREGGLIEEFRLDDAANNPQRSFELWDLLLYDKVVSEPNITLLLDTCALRGRGSRPARGSNASCRHAATRPRRSLSRPGATCSPTAPGDARLAHREPEPRFRWGARAPRRIRRAPSPPSRTESRETHGQQHPVHLEKTRPDRCPSPRRRWARKVDQETPQAFRGVGSWEYGYWWIEWGGQWYDTIATTSAFASSSLRHRARRLGLHQEQRRACRPSANWAPRLGRHDARQAREPADRRCDHILCQDDLRPERHRRDFDDAVAIGGWAARRSPSTAGSTPSRRRPFHSRWSIADVYNIPLRSLYSKDDREPDDGRAQHRAATHTAFSSTRVMGTCCGRGARRWGPRRRSCARRGMHAMRSPARRRRARLGETCAGRCSCATIRRSSHVKNDDPLDRCPRRRRCTASATHVPTRSDPMHVDQRLRARHTRALGQSLGGCRAGRRTGAWLELEVGETAADLASCRSPSTAASTAS